MNIFSKKILAILGITLLSMGFFGVLGVEITHAYDLAIPFGPTLSVNGPVDYIRMIYYFALGAGILLATGVIVVAGMRYTVSEAIGSKQDAMDQIKKAVLGLALLLTAILILQTIDPEIPRENLEVPAIPPAPPPAPPPPIGPPPPPPAQALTGVQIKGPGPYFTASWNKPINTDTKISVSYTIIFPNGKEGTNIFVNEVKSNKNTNSFWVNYTGKGSIKILLCPYIGKTQTTDPCSSSVFPITW